MMPLQVAWCLPKWGRKPCFNLLFFNLASYRFCRYYFIYVQIINFYL